MGAGVYSSAGAPCKDRWLRSMFAAFFAGRPAATRVATISESALVGCVVAQAKNALLAAIAALRLVTRAVARAAASPFVEAGAGVGAGVVVFFILFYRGSGLLVVERKRNTG
jgi:hypothetical protein